VIRRALDGGILTLTFDRPEARNALTPEMLDALAAGFDEAERDVTVRAVVLRAVGPSFCAGGDFGGFRRLIAQPAPEDTPDPIVAANRSYGAVLERLAGLTVPTIAVVAGAAFGGGVGFVAASDFVLARADATFRLPEVTLGLPPAQVAPFVADRIGPARARQLMLTAEVLDAEAALRYGLVDFVAADDAELEAELTRIIGALDRAEPAALRATKAILAHDRLQARGATLDFAAEHFARALRSAAVSERLAARAPSSSPPAQPSTSPSTSS
jgi:isohexenylglutaconyl-CoA hydratase